MTRQTILDFLKHHKTELQDKYGISELALFGSYARDEAHENSDVDIAIKTPLSDYFKLYNLKEELEEAFKTSVDLIRIRDKMNPYLMKRIEKDGIFVR
jgi:predicted nucleotidyltransferase